MEHGEWTENRYLKPGAVMPYTDDDYIIERVWVEFTTDEMRHRLQSALSETDYFASQCLEDLFEAIGSVEPFDLLGGLKILKAIVQWNLATLSKYGEMIAKRKAWREELRELG